MTKGKQEATGTDIVQIGRDLHITIQQTIHQAAVPMLSREQRQRIASLVAEVEAAENQLVSQRRVRYALNRELCVGSIDQVTSEMYNKAVVYLGGWRACAAAEHQGIPAMVSQVIRIWTVAPSLQMEIARFLRDQFATTKLNDLSYWQMRCTLAYAMQCWTDYWKARGN